MKIRKIIEEKRSNAIVLEECDTDYKYGKRPEDRSIEEHIKYGVINLDKPRGPTSHEIITWIKQILNVKKAGHGGTLDPKVSGVLPVALEESTKVLTTLLQAGKEYVCVAHFHEDFSYEELKKAVKYFTGKIYQRPPLKSAVKRSLRVRTIYSFDILEINGRDVLFKISCEAGTYVRKLISDLGEYMGIGAHMEELRRIRVGNFTEENNLVTLHDVKDAYDIWKETGKEDLLRKVILPVEFAVSHLPWIFIKDSAVSAVCHGANLAIPGICMIEKDIKKNSLVAIVTLKNELVAIGRALMDTEEIIRRKRGFAVKVDRVIMPRNIYPKAWRKRLE